jgi:hypothetical protein
MAARDMMRTMLGTERVHAVAAPDGIEPVSIRQKVQIRFVGQGHTGTRPGPVEQSPPNGIHHRAAGHHWLAGRLRRQEPATIRVVEQPADERAPSVD